MSSDLKLGGCLKCALKIFPLPHGDFRPAHLATRKLDGSLLSDSHMAVGVEVTVVPAFLTQISAVWSTCPILTEDCSWSSFPKYLQYGQPLSAELQLLQSHVLLWRLEGVSFFICLATTHLTWLIP